MTRTATALIPLILAAALAAGGCAASTDHVILIDKVSPTTTTARTLGPATYPGILTGQLIMEGGAIDLPTPQGGNPRPIPGTVNFIQHGRPVATALAGANGKFSMALGPGEYQVQACTSRIQMVSPDGTHIDTCETIVQVHVLANQTTTVAIPSFIVP
jgi:hypothetical protein